ncbi:MAG: RNA polymerase sigma factor [Tissierellia bacterium]|nr:RNA polymerase sigma factor [Tissierellia bacterium]
MKDIEKIYKLYKDNIFKYLISLTYNPSLSEDLLSETFIRAIKSIYRFKGDSNIKTWLFSIARYTWYDYLIFWQKECRLLA